MKTVVRVQLTNRENFSLPRPASALVVAVRPPTVPPGARAGGRAARGEALRTIGRLLPATADRRNGLDVAEHGEGAGVGAPGGQEEGSEEGGEGAHARGRGFGSGRRGTRKAELGGMRKRVPSFREEKKCIT